jgi:hypothetical protein
VAKPVTQIKINKRGAAELLKSPEVRALLRERADAVAARARATAPVNTGDYRNSIQVESATTDRAVERVVAKDRKSLIIESKTGNLVRALGAEGG